VKRLHPDPEIEALIHRLNESARQVPEPVEASSPTEPVVTPPAAATRFKLPQPSDEERALLARLLGQARSRHASDLLLVTGKPPVVRTDGELHGLGEPALDADAAARLCAALVAASRRQRLEETGTADFAFGLEGAGRFRANVHRESGHWAAAVRLLPEATPELAALHLPDALGRLCGLRHGLVLVTGPTGSGKSTTLAAMLRRLLELRPRIHLITIEDPVEFPVVHPTAVVEHVEIGRDCLSFPAALRSALRQNPDVLVVGEMRDPESISIAITAAETGHLVLSTLHTTDAPQTVHRILDSYPAAQMETIRAQLAVSLAAVVSQQLLPRADRPGRVPAVEILIATHAVRNLVRQGKISQLRSQLALEKGAGMLSLDASLARLVRRGLVDVEQARHRARVPEELAEMLRRPEP
jgi:twitching motility protein PilT